MDEAAGLTPGGSVGNYTLVQKLRDGGMASLFLARRTGVHGFTRPVAIKVVHTHLSGQHQFVQMFVDEALLSSHLNHPNIVHVEEFGELPDGRCFLAMEYIDGCSLSEWCRLMHKRAGGGDHRLVTHIGIRVAEALEAAHTAVDANGVGLGVVHRDVSPGNILLSRRGHIKVVDFGIAKSSLRTEHTVESLKGKLRYMSPEQAQGADLDVRTDIYSLAIVMWELLAGRRMFDAKRDMALLDEVREPKIVPPSQHVDGIPPQLDAVILKALSRAPADRYATSMDFARALREAVPSASSVEAADVAALVGTIPQRNVDRATMTGTGAGSLESRLTPSHLRAVDPVSNSPELPLGVPLALVSTPDDVQEPEGDASFDVVVEDVDDGGVDPGGVSNSDTAGFEAGHPGGRSKRGLLAVAVLALFGLGGLVVWLTDEEGRPDVTSSDGEMTPTETPPLMEPSISPAQAGLGAAPQRIPHMDAVALPSRSTWGEPTVATMDAPPTEARPHRRRGSMSASMGDVAAAGAGTNMASAGAPTMSVATNEPSTAQDPEVPVPEPQTRLADEGETSAHRGVRVETGTRMRAPLVD